jgi:hypothetical protein
MSKTLVEYFNQNRRDTFKAKLQKVKNLQEIADTIHDELASYADIEGSYIQSLTPSEAKTALALLSILRESNDAMGDASVAFKQESPKKESSPQQSPQSLVTQDTIVITISAGVGTSIGLFGGPLGAIFGAAMGSGCGKILTDLIKEKSDRGRNPKKQNDIQLNLDVNKLMSELVKLLGKLDNLIVDKHKSSEPLPLENKTELSDFPEIIEFIQKLAGQRYSGLSKDLDFAMQDELPSLLRVYGLQIDELPPEQLSNLETISRELYHSYNIETSRNLSDPVVDTPAILKDDQILLKGKIRIPAQSK